MYSHGGRGIDSGNGLKGTQSGQGYGDGLDPTTRVARSVYPRIDQLGSLLYDIDRNQSDVTGPPADKLSRTHTTSNPWLRRSLTEPVRSPH